MHCFSLTFLLGSLFFYSFNPSALASPSSQSQSQSQSQSRLDTSESSTQREFCEESSEWMNAPVAIEAESLHKELKLKQVNTELSLDQISQIIGEQANQAARDYCSRNQKTCEFSKCPFVSHFEIGHTPSENSLHVNLANIQTQITENSPETLMAYLDAAGLIPRVRKICCTSGVNGPPARESSILTEDSRFLRSSEAARPSIVDEFGAYLSGSIEEWKKIRQSKMELSRHVHPRCRLPLKPKLEKFKTLPAPNGILKAILYAPYNLKKALGFAFYDMIRHGGGRGGSGSSSSNPQTAGSTTLIPLMAGNTPLTQALQNQVVNEVAPGTLHWISQTWQYFVALSIGIEPDSYYLSTIGMHIDEVDQKLEQIYKKFSNVFIENMRSFKQEQVSFINHLFEKLEKELNIAKRDKARGAVSQNSENVISRMAGQSYEGVVIRESDLDNPAAVFKNLAESHTTLLRTMKLLGKRTPLYDLNRVEACREYLGVHSEYSDFLNQLAQGVFRRTQQPRDQQGLSHGFYVFGEPGTLKTSGVQRLAKCTGIPICIISETSLMSREYEKNKDTALNSGSNSGSILTLNSNGQQSGSDSSRSSEMRSPWAARLKAEVNRCLEGPLRTNDSDGVDNSTFEFDSIILIDDIDQILNNYLNPEKYRKPPEEKKNISIEDHTVVNIENDRKAFLGQIKNLSDPSQIFLDSETGFPIDLSGITWIVTANSVLPELRASQSESSPVLGSRMQLYSTPSPKRDFREAIGAKVLEKMKNSLMDRSLSQVEKALEGCSEAIQEIIQFDLQKWKERQKRLGIRPLLGFLENLSSYWTNKGNCLKFPVAAVASGFQEYKSSPNTTLLAYDFSSYVHENYHEIEKKLSDYDLTSHAQVKFSHLKSEALDESLSYHERKTRFDSIVKSFEYLPLKKEIAERNNQKIVPITRSELETNFKEKFENLLVQMGPEDRSEKSEKDSSQKIKNSALSRWQELASEIFHKMNNPNQPNRLVVLDPSPGADSWLIENLAHVFKAPYIHFSGKSGYEIIPPSWKKFISSGEFSPPHSRFAIPGLGDFVHMQFDPEKKLYLGYSTDKSRVGIFSGADIRDCRFGRPVLIMATDDLDQSYTVNHRWLKAAVQKWDQEANKASGFVLIETEEPELLIPHLKQVIQDSAYQFPSGSGGDDLSIRDLRKLTMVVLPVPPRSDDIEFDSKPETTRPLMGSSSLKGLQKEKDKEGDDEGKEARFSLRSPWDFPSEAEIRRQKRKVREQKRLIRLEFMTALAKDKQTFSVKLPGIQDQEGLYFWAERRFQRIVDEIKKQNLFIEVSSLDRDALRLLVDELLKEFRKIDPNALNFDRPETRESARKFENQLEIFERAMHIFAEQIQRRSQNVFSKTDPTVDSCHQIVLEVVDQIIHHESFEEVLKDPTGPDLDSQLDSLDLKTNRTEGPTVSLSSSGSESSVFAPAPALVGSSISAEASDVAASSDVAQLSALSGSSDVARSSVLTEPSGKKKKSRRRHRR